MDYQALFNCILSEKTLSIHCFSCPLPTGSEPAVDLCPPCACLRCFCLHPPYSPVRNPHLSLISQRVNFLIRTSANQTLHRDFQRGWPKLHSSLPHNTSVLSMALAPPKWERITAALVSSGNHPYLTCCFKCLFRKPRNCEKKKQSDGWVLTVLLAECQHHILYSAHAGEVLRFPCLTALWCSWFCKSLYSVVCDGKRPPQWWEKPL